MLIHDMDIARLMTHAQQIEEAKLKGKAREKKRSINDDGDSSHVRSDGHGRSRNRQRWLAGSEGCFSCGESGHKMRNCPKMKAKGREGKQVAPSGSDGNTLKKNMFYALQARGEQECPLDVTTGSGDIDFHSRG
ncbi:uncharacterized protein LOC125829282 [Solanum verrucosum]|uniref:uncharacterized protein LOC125829282 n=1 Tax=Solanum verrucosum TaxID=315347 RepID=UPI0020D1DAC0|nr:uncharacterized protein LOC125829282 [Solanum verrucosum]